jgi:predicted acylesterase/phospholipase RssA
MSRLGGTKRHVKFLSLTGLLMQHEGAQMKKIKRAIALSGGGPPVGLQVGALKALNEFNIEFDVFTTDCIGSWTACIYNSHHKAKRISKMEQFYNACFVPDDIFDGFSVPINIFVTDYYEDFKRYWQKLFDYRTYQGLFLPQRQIEYLMKYLNPINFPKTSTDLSMMFTEAMSLNPYVRLMFKLNYQSPKTGRSWLLGPGNHGEDFVDQFIDFNKLMRINPLIYLNAFNLTQKEINLFVNRTNHPSYKPITLTALKANSSILGYLENIDIDGQQYCEGAVVDTVNFNDLLINHPDLNEVWVINILGYKEVKPPKNQLEADLLAVELPFATIAQSDIKLFAVRLKETGLDKKIKLIKIDLSYKDLDFFWKHSTLEKGIEVGYEGALAAIHDYHSPSNVVRMAV